MKRKKCTFQYNLDRGKEENGTLNNDKLRTQKYEDFSPCAFVLFLSKIGGKFDWIGDRNTVIRIYES